LGVSAKLLQKMYKKRTLTLPSPGRTGRGKRRVCFVRFKSARGILHRPQHLFAHIRIAKGRFIGGRQAERRAAALAHVRTFGDPVLKSRATEVRTFGPELEHEAQQMISIMRDALGVGLAAL